MAIFEGLGSGARVSVASLETWMAERYQELGVKSVDLRWWGASGRVGVLTDALKTRSMGTSAMLGVGLEGPARPGSVVERERSGQIV